MRNTQRSNQCILHVCKDRPSQSDTQNYALSLSRLRKFYENMKNLFLPPLNVPVCVHACVYDVRTSYIVWVCKCVSMKSQKQRDKRRNEDNLPFRWQHLTYNVLARTQTKTIIDIVHCCVWTSHIPCKQYQGESIETSPANATRRRHHEQKKVALNMSKYGF